MARGKEELRRTPDGQGQAMTFPLAVAAAAEFIAALVLLSIARTRPQILVSALLIACAALTGIAAVSLEQAADTQLRRLHPPKALGALQPKAPERNPSR